MITPGDVIPYVEMRGMNYHLKGEVSVILMSLRRGAPYADRIEDKGRTLIYERHDIPKRPGGPNPKTVDQPIQMPTGKLTQNGLFLEAAVNFKEGRSGPERVKVYEKILPGIWVFNGLFKLVDAWQETSNARRVFKFRLELVEEEDSSRSAETPEIDHERLIPTAVKLDVWKRDKGRCVTCGAQDNLHFDHIIPYSKGGSSLVSENIQLLCARHNLAKKDKIE